MRSSVILIAVAQVMASFSVETYQVFGRSCAVALKLLFVTGRLIKTDKVYTDAGALGASTGSAACCTLVTGGDLSGGLCPSWSGCDLGSLGICHCLPGTG